MSIMNYKIENPNSLDDYTKIDKFFTKIWAEEFEIFLENQIEKYQSSIIFFVRENNEIISAVTAHFRKNQWKIGRFGTDKNHRGKWIGTKIFAKILQYFEEKNISEIFIRAEITKVDFYKKFGFEICGEAEKSGNTEAILMKKIFKNTQMENIFDEWNILKNSIHNKQKISLVNEREICYTSIGHNIWFEQNGKNDNFERPVLVLKKFWKYTFIGIPLTSQEKSGKFYHTFSWEDNISTAILSQIRIFDSKRIIRKIWYISQDDFQILKNKLKNLLDLE